MVSAAGLQGVLSPVLTPFDRTGQPSHERFVRHCRWLLDQGVGLAVFGTNSEANSLTVREKRELLDALVAQQLPTRLMMPGTGACAWPDAVELTRHALAVGCAGVLMLPPFYYKGTGDDGLFSYFARVIEQVGDARLRIYLYHIPPVTQVPLSLALIERLLDSFPGVIAGVKDSGGDWAHTEAMIREFQPRGFDVFAGSETYLLQTMRAGGTGCITATANINPTAILRLYHDWRADDADAQQAALNHTRAIFQAYPLIAAMKTAIAWKSGDNDWQQVRPPLSPLAAQARRELEDSLARAGFDIPAAHRLSMAAAPDSLS
ncbi:dihydrodipicolinate synthase family protein [Paraburkholderia sediminicola]|uniref:Dihydrodipicolinate synthase family protein n=1 Tax=Paraburkholderia metrosideri TaxID=580937 RepID=A0ABW9DTR4_9BURK